MKGLLSPCAAVFVAVAPALADPVFTPAQTALPAAHIYAGGWEHFVGGGVAIFDCNGDARPDFYAAGGENEAALFVQNAQGPFGFALGQGIAPLRGVTGAYPIDIDSDGHVDLAVLRVGENRLLRGHGDCRFTDATEDWGFAVDDRWSTAFSATWEPGMRWPTLAVGNYVDRADPEGPFEACDSNQLYRPSGAGFAPPLELTPAFCALSMLFSDWTRSGAAELRISNDRHYYVRGGYEQMWRMDPLHERGQADGWSRVSLWGMGIASADLARDGYPDVMLTSMGDQVLHLNEAGDIVPAGYGSGTTAHRPHTGDDGRPSTGDWRRSRLGCAVAVPHRSWHRKRGPRQGVVARWDRIALANRPARHARDDQPPALIYWSIGSPLGTAPGSPSRPASEAGSLKASRNAVRSASSRAPSDRGTPA